MSGHRHEFTRASDAESLKCKVCGKTPYEYLGDLSAAGMSSDALREALSGILVRSLGGRRVSESAMEPPEGEN
jgi:hypothetical protein